MAEVTHNYTVEQVRPRIYNKLYGANT